MASELEEGNWKGGAPLTTTHHIIPVCPGSVTVRAPTLFNLSNKGSSLGHRVIFSILCGMHHCGATLITHTLESSTQEDPPKYNASHS